MANQTITLPTGGATNRLVVGYAAVITLNRGLSIRRRSIPAINTIMSPNVSIPDVKKASC